MSFTSFFYLCTRAMGWEDMGHVFNTHWLCCYQIRWQRGKQYANPGVCEQITDVKTDMAAVVLAKNTQQESDDWVTEYVRQRKVTVHNKRHPVFPVHLRQPASHNH